MDKLSHHDIEKWVTLYSDDLFRWTLYKAGDKETAEDVVQETFLSVVKSLDKFKGKSKAKTWLFSIINNKIIDHHRKGFREAVINQPLNFDSKDRGGLLGQFFDENDTWKSEMKPSGWKDVEGHLLDYDEFNLVLQECMKNLPSTWFSAIHFKYLDEKDGKQICQELGITSSNYWKMLQRAKLQLRFCIEENWFKT